VSGTRFKELAAYRQVISLADDLRAEVLEWNSLDTWSLGIQLLRAADSMARTSPRRTDATVIRINVGSCTWLGDQPTRQSIGSIAPAPGVCCRPDSNLG